MRNRKIYIGTFSSDIGTKSSNRMVELTRKEGEVLLKLFKDFSRDYNANSLSKEVEITPRGMLKILKKLESKGLARGKQFGKAIFYKVDLEDHYVAKIIETLLIAEAREKASRWLHSLV